MADFPIEDITRAEQLRDEELNIDVPISSLPTEDDLSSIKNEEIWTALQLGAKKVRLLTDSRLVASQFGDTFEARDGRIAAYIDLIHRVAHKFDSISIIQRPRSDVRHADALAYLSAAVEVESSRTILVEFQRNPSIDLPIQQLKDMYVTACLFYVDLKQSTSSFPMVSCVVNTRKRNYAGEEPSLLRDVVSDKSPSQENHNPLFQQEVDMTDSDHEADDSPDIPDLVIDLTVDLSDIEDWRTPYVNYLRDVLERDKALIDEVRDEALQHVTKYKDDMKRRYDRKVRLRSFKPDGWVL
ncbi:hypothetical protein FRX31_010637 [Thalictrum thalictroides]|uniref:RNase H type-1 domain-containing protein n=1 Tax=Thalictrum thalictroides TaxID=46969 RepID=A0A7J6WQZ0_THATH|nr:hypothetical protein FRX31_010637 [Thalictrum thalictroides]